MLLNAILATLDEQLTDAHVREDIKILDWSMSVDQSPENSSGQPWVIRIEILNPGIAILSPSQPRYVAFIEGIIGQPLSSCTVLAKAVVKPLSGDLGRQTAFLDCVCAPVDLQGRLLAYALTLTQNALLYDKLYEGLSFDAPQDVLQARSASFYCDPVTHALSLHDWIDGDGSAVFDLGAAYDWDSLHVTALKAPCPRVRLVVTAEWEQRARGICDVASQIDIAALAGGGSAAISTLNKSFIERADRQLPGGLVRLELGSGWTHEQNQDSVDVTEYETYSIPTGNTIRGQFVREYNTVTGSQTNYATNVTTYTLDQQQDTSTEDYQEFITFKGYSVYCDNVPIRYDYSQDRIETATLLVSMPIDDADLAGVAAEETLPDIKLGDLLQAYVPNPNPIPEPDSWGNYIIPYAPFIAVQPWSYDTKYLKGDVVEYVGQWYKANKSTQGYFYKSSNATTKISYDAFGNLTVVVGGGLLYQHPDWDAYVPDVALSDRRQPSFFDTARGLSALQHGILRCRAYLRKRLLSIQVAFTARWEDARDLTPGSRVRVLILSGEGRQPVVGKVTHVDRKWTPEGRTVEVTMLVPAGTGAAVTPSPKAATPYLDAAYATGTYVEDTDGTTEFAFGDMQWAWSAPLTYVPVNAYYLSVPSYSVLQCTVRNQAGYQMAIAASYGFAGLNPASAAADYPTSMTVVMRPIASTGPIERLFDVAAIVTVSPRGINLTVAGAEP